MARRLNVTDGYTIVNAMMDEALGKNATIQAIDASSFVSVGETLLATGVENVINTLSLVASRSLIAVRPYEAKFRLMNALDSGVFSDRIRKISYYAKEAVPTGASNTQLFLNLAMGFDNNTNPDANNVPQSVESQYYQSQPVPLELWFSGSTEWQYPYTLYENALKKAFRSPEEWTKFLNGFLVSCANDIEQEKESFSRLAVLNAIAGVANLSASMPGSFRNLTAEFNAEFNISPAYTTQELLTTHFREFLEFYISTVKNISDKLEDRTINYHWSPAKTVNGVSYVLPRQTAKSDQRMLAISKFWNDAEARVLPEIFNDKYLKLENFEKITFWQNANDAFAVKGIPAIPDVNNPTAQIAGTAVDLPVVLSVIYDRDAILVDFHLDDVSSTNKEARKHYRTIWNTIQKNIINDFTENIVVLYMAD